MTRIPRPYARLSAAAGLALAAATLGVAAGALGGGPPALFKADPDATTQARIGYFPIPLALAAKKPAGITKEPAYRAAPKYAVIRLGNGPRSAVFIAVDEPADSDYRIYVDANQNGDLTDDGDGAWSKKVDRNGRVMYGVNSYKLRASYGARGRETASAPYGLSFYRFVAPDRLLYYRTGARVGQVTIDGKAHKALLVENDADALYNKPVTDADKAGDARPVWLLVDLNDDGKYASGPVDIRAPFKLADRAYEATVTPDGSKVALAPTTKPVADLRPKPKPVLADGTVAPDFTAQKWGGGDLKLSDYRGKVVVLDFWATWCGPCQRSMPHVEKVWKAVQGQDVAVLGVCVWDEKPAYEKWVPENKDKYTFQFAYDPAGRSDSSIAGKLFGVSGIPTTFVIDRDGKVAAGIVGYDDGDTRVEDALRKLGVKIEEPK
ncbi:MAG: TlpA family protein disulfide reductase [Chthonomonadales bacterium]|nr:TlpA family protein disulfide reductase [Chthonomonadales bacterium]